MASVKQKRYLRGIETLSGEVAFKIIFTTLLKLVYSKRKDFALVGAWFSGKLKGTREICLPCQKWQKTQLAFYENLHRAVIGPSATLTGR